MFACAMVVAIPPDHARGMAEVMTAGHASAEYVE